MNRVRSFGAASVLLVAIALIFTAAASATFNPPTFGTQWEVAPTGPPSFNSAESITTDPFGDVYVVKNSGGGLAHVLKYRSNGTPVAGEWSDNVSDAGFSGIATDAVGHVFLIRDRGITEYTSTGVELGSFPLPGLSGPILAIDGAGNVYADGVRAGSQHTINEYAFSAGGYDLAASRDFPGTPSNCCSPYGFLGITVDPSGNVYASGMSTTEQFLLRFPPGLSGPPAYLEHCSTFTVCLPGFGIAFANTSTKSGTEAVIYSAGGYGDGTTSNQYRVGMYRATPNRDGTSTYEGSYGQQPVPGGAFTDVGQIAASACTHSIYELVNAFGGPNGTINDQFVQRFDTGAPAPPCAIPAVPVAAGFNAKYLLRVRAGASGPCVPCAPLLASGSPVPPKRSTLEAPASRARSKKTGVTFRFHASAAGDVTFAFQQIKGKHRKLGGFLFPARAGKNSLTFTGVLRKGKPLPPGSYKVKATGGGKATHFRVTVLKR